MAHVVQDYGGESKWLNTQTHVTCASTVTNVPMTAFLTYIAVNITVRNMTALSTTRELVRLVYMTIAEHGGLKMGLNRRETND